MTVLYSHILHAIPVHVATGNDRDDASQAHIIQMTKKVIREGVLIF